MFLLALVLIGAPFLATAQQQQQQQQRYGALPQQPEYEPLNPGRLQPIVVLPLNLELPKEEAPAIPFSVEQNPQENEPIKYQPQQFRNQEQVEEQLRQFPPQNLKSAASTVTLSPVHQLQLKTDQFQQQVQQFQPQAPEEVLQLQMIKQLPTQITQEQPKTLQLPSEEPYYQPKQRYSQVLQAPQLYSRQIQVEEPQQFLQPPVASLNPFVNFNGEFSVPSQDLKAPSAEPWNPDNDPKYYYKLPVVLTKQENPTNSYPKKFNKEVHEKSKPVSSRPKQQYDLVPISPTDYVQQQKETQKTRQNFEKKLNQKLAQDEKVQENSPKPEVIKKVESTDSNGKGKQDAVGASSDFSHEYSAEGGIDAAVSSEADDESHEDFNSPLGSNPLGPAPNERLEFQVHGFDGPLSYKWGFDTGKGHNRQFRYEERDKFGHVKGHYGYYDKHGKLRMVHYNAPPHGGFNAETENFGSNKDK